MMTSVGYICLLKFLGLRNKQVWLSQSHYYDAWMHEGSQRETPRIQLCPAKGRLLLLLRPHKKKTVKFWARKLRANNGVWWEEISHLGQGEVVGRWAKQWAQWGNAELAAMSSWINDNDWEPGAHGLPGMTTTVATCPFSNGQADCHVLVIRGPLMSLLVLMS